MVEDEVIDSPEVGDQPPQTPPQNGDEKLRALHAAVSKDYDIGDFDQFKQKLQDPEKRKSFYNTIGNDYHLGTYDEFEGKLGIQKQQPAPEHQIQHTALQDVRHLSEMADRPIAEKMQSLDNSGYGSVVPDEKELEQSKLYKDQFNKGISNLSSTWGTDPEATKSALKDFPDEQDENKLKGFATLAKTNPVQYGRLKDSNDIRLAIAKNGPEGIHDANIFNHLQNADNYHDLVEVNIPIQRELMAKHGLDTRFDEKLRNSQSPLINTLDPDLLDKYWNSSDKEYGLTPAQYAGLETERAFNPNKAHIDEEIIKHSRGIGEDGKANPKDLSGESYEYRRGIENVLYNLEQQGRINTARYISGHKPEIERQVKQLQAAAQEAVNNAQTKQEQAKVIEDFNSNPLVQQYIKLEQGEDELQYADSEDERKFPLNFSDKATRLVKDALGDQGGFAGKVVGNVIRGAGESADNTMRWIANTAVNLVGDDETKAFVHSSDIGHQALSELTAYQPKELSGTESPLLVSPDLTKKVQDIFKDNSLSDFEKQVKATRLVSDNMDQVTINPKGGQHGLTPKIAIYGAANTIGQILGIANQSFLMGGAIGDIGKLKQMANAFTPMFMSTQNQMYEQALKNGDEHPLLKSNVDATILSLASLINPDIKVVRGMVGAESGMGKFVSGISDETWNKVLSENGKLYNSLSAGVKATGKQLGLANLQYGLIAPTAQYLAHKSILHEDANLGDMIKDGVIQTSISMALPALLHGAFGGMKANEVNPQQKYALVEAGLHPDQNIELIDSIIKNGEISEIQGHEMKQVVKHTGEILQNTEMVKTDGTPMNEKEIADTVYNMLRVRTLEGKMKNAAGPLKPIIEQRIHEVNQDIAELHTSESDKQKNELNQLLTDNIPRIKEKMPAYEQAIKDAVKENNPEEVFKMIADQALETIKVDGKEVSSRAATEEIFGKKLVDKAIEISKQKPKEIPKLETEDNVNEKPSEEPDANKLLSDGAGSSISVIKPGELSKPNIVGPVKSEEKVKSPINRIRSYDNPLALNGESPETIMHFNQGPNHGRVTLLVDPLVKLEYSQKLRRWKAMGPENSSGMKHILKDIAKGLRGKNDIIVNLKGVDLSRSAPDIVEQIKSEQDASTIRSNPGQVPETGTSVEGSKNESGENLQQPQGQEAVNAPHSEQAGEEIKTVGVRHASLKSLAKRLGLKDPERGTFLSAEEQVKRGRTLLKAGADPEEIAQDFLMDGEVSADNISVARAHYENLIKEAQSAYDTYGKDSEEYKSASDKADQWQKEIMKPMGTAAGAAFTALQGETDLNTGSFIAMKKVVEEFTGKPLTPEQEKTITDLSTQVKTLNEQIDELKTKLTDALNKGGKEKEGGEIKESAKKLAKKIRDNAKLNRPGMFSAATPASLVWDGAVEVVAKSIELGGSLAQAISDGVAHIKESDWYKGLSEKDQKNAENQFVEWHNKADKDASDLAEKFANKKDNKFTPEEATEVWEHMRENYVDNGDNINDAVKKTSDDLGLSAEQVLQAISSPKGAREVTQEMFRKEYQRRKAMNAAKTFVANSDKSGMAKFFNKLPNAFFNLKTYGHGTVGFLTHAGPNIFRPSVWKAYWPNFLNQFKFAYGDVGKYEMALTKLESSPNFDAWRQAGLAVDPKKAYDQYQNFEPPKTKVGQKLNWVGEAGTRGFNALKFLRYDMAEMFYNKASDAEKADPKLREEIAELVNHATGHTEVKLPKWTNKVFFAPGLEVSRWQRMITDPAMAINTFANWSKKTPAEQAAAKIVAKGAGERLATYGALLAANAGWLAAAGSKQQTNLNDPSKSDWLKFKTAGKTLDFSGGVLSPLRILEGLAQMSYYSGFGDKKDLREKPQEKAGKTLITQARYKLSPLAGVIAEGAFGTDALGNPTPWSKVPAGPGKHKLDWVEYSTSQLPIPVAAGVKAAIEGMQEKGMSKPEINDIMNGLLQFGVEGFTGVKLADDYELKKEESKERRGGHKR